jgi:hypothetical protein
MRNELPKACRATSRRSKSSRATVAGPALIALFAWGCTGGDKLKAIEAVPGQTDAATVPATDRADGAMPGVSLPGAGDAGEAGSPRARCGGGAATAAPRPCAELGVIVTADYAPDYACFDLGAVPGLPPKKYGGLTLTQEACSNTLLIGGDANTPAGKLYALKVRRDPTGHIVDFDGTAAIVADAPHNDGGITYGPGGVLFFARWPRNQLQQTRPGSALADKVIDLVPFGVGFSSASLAFVPPGFPGAGQFKLVAWPNGEWYTLTLVADGLGTYNVKKVGTIGRASPGGPEGFVYVAAGNPRFTTPSVLVSEWNSNRVSAYTVDKEGEPVVDSRKDFITGLQGAEGAYRDPATGDFFFSTFSNNADRVIVVRGFLPITID